VTTCPSRAQLNRLLAERLSEDEEQELASHLEAALSASKSSKS
jgi:hypothetical protein